MHVLVSDPLSNEGIAVLKSAEDIEVDVKVTMTNEELIECIGKYDALVVRSGTQVTKDIINAGKNLKVIGRAGVGLDNIDVKSATKQGIIVMNTPEGNTIATAEHTMAMLLSTTRMIPQAYTSLKSRVWERKKFVGKELCDKTLGIIGLGRIGVAVAKRAQAFNMKTIGYDPFLTDEKARALEIKLVELEEIWANADYITIHTPLTDKTKYLIGQKEIDKMKDGVTIINCARGGIIEERALYEGLKSGKIWAAALDVFEIEPPLESPLLDLSNCVVVPHLGASTQEAQVNVGTNIAQQIVDTLRGGPIKNAVNIPQLDSALLKEMTPYIDLAEKLGSFIGQIIVEGKISELKIEYQGEIIEHNTSPLTIAILKGFFTSLLGDPMINFVNASIIAQERGIKIVEAKCSKIEDFANLTTISLKIDDKEKTVSGALISQKPRIISIDKFNIDAIPEGHLLILYQTDEPGIIGKVGTILGRERINIGWMQLSRISSGGQAMSIWNVDDKVPQDILNEIEGIKEILSAKSVKL